MSIAMSLLFRIVSEILLITARMPQNIMSVL